MLSRAGRPGLPGGKNFLYHNAGDGTFEDVSQKSGVARIKSTYALGVSTLDFDNDGWTDIYVANDSNPSVLYRNNHDGTFTDIGVSAGCALSQDGRSQSGMGIAIGDYDRNGTMDIFKTNFAGDTSTLYSNTGHGWCEDRTFASGIGVNTRWLGWGVGFIDLDNDGWLDLFLVNGHVYPEVDSLKSEAAYKQPKVVYRNLGNGRFRDVTAELGLPLTINKASRGAAFADFDNDGDLDVVVNNVDDALDLFRLDQTTAASLDHSEACRHDVESQRHRRAGPRDHRGRRAASGSARRWQLLLTERSAAAIRVGRNQRSIDRVVVRWPNGAEETWTGLAGDRLHTLIEGSGSH